MKNKNLLVGGTLVVVAVFLFGCNLLTLGPTQSEPTNTPVPTDTPAPTDTSVPTDTPVPTNTAVPTQAPTFTSTPTSSSEGEPVRIQFAAGSISAQESGSLAAFGRDRYVLRAAKDQEMTVNLRITSGPGALLIIWGEDGSVFVTDHSETTYWQGKLPLTQDYFITVVASPDGPVSYVLEVTIPPL